MLLALDLIRTDGGKQTCTTTNITQANGYVEDMAAGAVCPLVDVFFDGSDYWLADGFHRLIACRSLGLAEIEVEVHNGSRHDARNPLRGQAQRRAWLAAHQRRQAQRCPHAAERPRKVAMV